MRNLHLSTLANLCLLDRAVFDNLIWSDHMTVILSCQAYAIGAIGHV